VAKKAPRSQKRTLSAANRRLLYARQSGLCNDCEAPLTGEWDAHHIEGYEWSVTQETNFFRMIGLCKNCHKVRHAKR
jgi:5-methylcytosine-specific restriction endonuclease McrA